jgi:hypothetical protein
MHILSYLLNSQTPWSSVLLEKLIDAPLGIAFVESEAELLHSQESAIYMYTYILTQINSVHALAPRVFKVSFIIIF